MFLEQKQKREDSERNMLKGRRSPKFQSLLTFHFFLSSCDLNVLKFSWYELLFLLVIHFPSCTKLHVRIRICHPRGKKWSENKRACRGNRRKDDCPSLLLRPSPGIDTRPYSSTVAQIPAQQRLCGYESKKETGGWLFQSYFDGQKAKWILQLTPMTKSAVSIKEGQQMCGMNGLREVVNTYV